MSAESKRSAWWRRVLELKTFEPNKQIVQDPLFVCVFFSRETRCSMSNVLMTNMYIMQKIRYIYIYIYICISIHYVYYVFDIEHFSRGSREGAGGGWVSNTFNRILRLIANTPGRTNMTIAGKSPFYNRRYIFKWLFCSFFMLVFGEVCLLKVVANIKIL